VEARLIAALAFAAVASADPYVRQPDVDVEHYSFSLSLSDTTAEITAEARVDLRFRRPGVREFWLDLGMAMRVENVRANNVDLPWLHMAHRLHITRRSDAVTDSVVIRYRGAPTAGLRIGPNRHGRRTFFSWNWPDLGRHWLPLMDHPSDKATSEFRITAPAHYQAVANGALIEQTDLPHNRRLTHWRNDRPIASWLNAIAVAEFSVRHIGLAAGVPVSNWVFPEDSANGAATFDEPSRRALEFFNGFIGPYPYPKLANVQATGYSGAMEHASVVFYGEKNVTPKPAARLVAHELAHQWFGNSITARDWEDVWLSEGFATYFALLFIEHAEGRDTFVDGLRQSRRQIESMQKTMPGMPVVRDSLDAMSGVINGLVYQKGAWTLHMLRSLIGDAAFRNGIREYYARFHGANATTADFRRIMERHAGRPLDWFFDQWLRRPARPAVEGQWHYDTVSKTIHLQLRQSHPGPPYRLALDLAIDNTRIETLELSTGEQHFTFPAPQPPQSLELDPHTRLLAALSLRPR
jgi:aminopeptidase N